MVQLPQVPISASMRHGRGDLNFLNCAPDARCRLGRSRAAFQTVTGQNGKDPRPRRALRVNEIEVAGPRDFDQAARGELLAHSQRHRVIVNAVNEADPDGRNGQRGGIGDRIRFGNVIRSAAHQEAHRPRAQIPFRAQAQ